MRAADEAYSIGPAPSRDLYLRVDKILDVARRSGADAIHPGYGFLAENADFAQAVMDAGLVWIGPPPDAMRLLGDKLTARHTAQAAGVLQSRAAMSQWTILSRHWSQQSASAIPC